MNILLTIAYDGTEYCGWQFQENGVSVQETAETALTHTLGTAVRLTGASRTDAGVHALGQQAAFQTEKLMIPIEKLCLVANKYLPGDVSFRRAGIVPEDFHPRFGAKRKTYVYRIENSSTPNPLTARYSWHVPRPLDVGLMRDAAAAFVGEHDFKAFCATGGSAKTTVRTIYALEVSEAQGQIEISVTGNGFLYNMVRIIAGTLMYAGQKKITPGDMPSIIAKGDRTLAGKTAPPEGLTLIEIIY